MIALAERAEWFAAVRAGMASGGVLSLQLRLEMHAELALTARRLVERREAIEAMLREAR